MILLIDAGNTRIKFGWLQTSSRESEPLALPHDKLESQLPSWLLQLPAAPVRAIGVNVAGDTMAARIQALLPCPIDWIHSTPAVAGLINGYRNPFQLGPDRWLALIGLSAHAHQDPGKPLLLASFGTATTIDSLSPVKPADETSDKTEVRRFQGELILPGVGLMQQSLTYATANLAA